MVGMVVVDVVRVRVWYLHWILYWQGSPVYLSLLVLCFFINRFT